MFSLGHLSDLHATPVVVKNPLQLLNKRFFGWISWQIKRQHYHRTSVIDALMDDLSQAPIDHLVVTGDLTNLSLASEFGAAREGLKRLGDARDVSIVPGNHDAYVRVAQSRSWNLWSDYFESDEAETAAEASDPRDRFPTLRIRGPLAVVGLCSALPTRLFDASGTLGDAQLDRLERMLHGLAERDLCRVISIHHPITVRCHAHAEVAEGCRAAPGCHRSRGCRPRRARAQSPHLDRGDRWARRRDPGRRRAFGVRHRAKAGAPRPVPRLRNRAE